KRAPIGERSAPALPVQPASYRRGCEGQGCRQPLIPVKREIVRQAPF
ncbi:hypothetical protein AVEN_124846-1, partial [Araneus ventricosus]